MKQDYQNVIKDINKRTGSGRFCPVISDDASSCVVTENGGSFDDVAVSPDLP